LAQKVDHNIVVGVNICVVDVKQKYHVPPIRIGVECDVAAFGYQIESCKTETEMFVFQLLKALKLPPSKPIRECPDEFGEHPAPPCSTPLGCERALKAFMRLSEWACGGDGLRDGREPDPGGSSPGGWGRVWGPWRSS
jgi:hypothetical protein